LWGLGKILWAEGARTALLVEIPFLLLAVGSGAVVYGLVLYWLRLPELRLVVDRLRERFSRRGINQI
ncbi:MAG TPA: hypothetical protein VLA15_10320, partial [Desulfurivibrionaceae bacterium]|nr:hypothetical protein [Desulfurivibrionaceae bacterium]